MECHFSDSSQIYQLFSTESKQPLPDLWSEARHLTGIFKKMEAVAKMYFHDNISIPTLPLTEKGKKFYQELLEHHRNLRRIETKFNDFKRSAEVESVKEELIKLETVKQTELSEENFKKKEQCEKKYSSIHCLTPESPTFEFNQKRQAFLDTMHKIMLYYKSLNIESDWEVDTSKTIENLTWMQSFYKLWPKGSQSESLLKHFDKEISDHRAPFSNIFLECALQNVFTTHQVYHSGIATEYSDIQFFSLNCINQFSLLREELDKDTAEQSVEAAEILKPLILFAQAFRKVKEKGMEITNQQIQTVKDQVKQIMKQMQEE